jgi:hypothetical protein
MTRGAGGGGRRPQTELLISCTMSSHESHAVDGTVFRRKMCIFMQEASVRLNMYACRVCFVCDVFLIFQGPPAALAMPPELCAQMHVLCSYSRATESTPSSVFIVSRFFDVFPYSQSAHHRLHGHPLLSPFL